MSFKNIAAERTTVTRDTILVEEKTGNIYESLVAISKRANQISSELKRRVDSKVARVRNPYRQPRRNF